MCVPGAPIATNVVSSVIKSALDTSKQLKEQQYRAQIAVNNIKEAQNDALAQKQIGIEKSRVEKLDGIKKANTILAQQASSGVDASSDTNTQNYYDLLSGYFSNANDIENFYNTKAESYFSKANSYFNEYSSSNKSGSSNFNKAINFLGSSKKVASNWYFN